MTQARAALPVPAEDDAGYPTRTALDPDSPFLTQEPLLPIFDGVALPATWSRLGEALSGALGELWRAHGGSQRYQPEHWIALLYGRIYVNAHAFERLRALVAGEEPDPGLVPARQGFVAALEQWLHARRARRSQVAYRERLRRAEGRSTPILARAASLDLSLIETLELARGPLDRGVWVELLLPWLAARVSPAGEQSPPTDPAPVYSAMVREGIRFEQRCAAELGRRFTRMKICSQPADVVYLTLEERCAALRDPGPVAARVASRRARTESFAALELPPQCSAARPTAPPPRAPARPSERWPDSRR
jgi:hypothetical protein